MENATDFEYHLLPKDDLQMTLFTQGLVYFIQLFFFAIIKVASVMKAMYQQFCVLFCFQFGTK